MPFITSSKYAKQNIDFEKYKPIDVIFCIFADGHITPMRFKITNPDESEETYNIEGITQTKEFHGGVSFRCLITCYGRQYAITLLFYIEDHLWVTPLN